MNAGRAIELQEQAWSLQAEGKLDQALIACREALRLMEESEGPDSPDAANLLNDLAEIENDRQNFDPLWRWPSARGPSRILGAIDWPAKPPCGSV